MTIKTILSVAILSGLVFTGTTDTTLANGVQSFKPSRASASTLAPNEPAPISRIRLASANSS
jgi:hypothetical protein